MHNRLYERVPFFCEAALIVAPAATPVAARSFDISLGGVGLATRASVERGRTVSVAFHLKGPHGEIVEQVAGRVMNLQADDDGNRLGIEFLEPLRAATAPELTRRLEKL